MVILKSETVKKHLEYSEKLTTFELNKLVETLLRQGSSGSYLKRYCKF